jgi:subtilisin family serine protease
MGKFPLKSLLHWWPLQTHRRFLQRFCVLICLLMVGSVSVRLAASHPAQERKSALPYKPVDRSQTPKYRPDKVLVRFRPGVQRNAMQAAHDQINAKVLSEPAIVDRLHVVQLGGDITLESALRKYRGNNNVLYAEPDYLVHASGVPNDPQFALQWNMQNTGQSGGTAGADIHATQAWGISTGSPNVVVAVLDTGVDYSHQDLAANVWSSTNGFSAIDQNGNPVQCGIGSHGLNAVSGTCDPLDDNAHGSHVAGIIGALGNNSMGVTGVNWKVQILPCKFLDATGAGDIASAIACLDLIQQLKDSGINIVATNNSWGGSNFSQSLQDAIAAQLQDGILFVAAAGNDFSDNDEIPTYPANISLPNILSVAATDRTDGTPGFSNLGRHTVHLGAPGSEILSTTPNNTYSVFSGTSMAAPHVTGVAALLKAQDPSRDWKAIKNLILAGGDSIPSLAQTVTQNRLNAFKAMTCSNATVKARLLPINGILAGTVGSPIPLSFLNINCSQPAGNVAVQVTPGGQTIALTDDGSGTDQAAGDGVYSGQWTPAASGSYTLTFPDGSTVTVNILGSYGYIQAPFSYTTITGTDLSLGDDAVATVTPPFPIEFGGGSFSQMFVSSNGTISFTDAYSDYNNSFGLATSGTPSFVQRPNTLVAPYWMDLFPVKGTPQNVFWAVAGNAPNRQLVVEWRNVRSFLCRSAGSTAVTFEVVFQENSNNILFNYQDTIFGGNCTSQDDGQAAVIGVQTSPTTSVEWSFQQQVWTSGGTSILWQSPPPAPPKNPMPVLTSISPTSAPLFSPDVSLTANGSGFIFGSFVRWNSTSVPTTYVSSTQLKATLPAALFAPFANLSAGGTPQVTVFNPAPGGGTSNSLPFSILAAGVPSITSISPSSANAGGFSFPLDVKGNNLYQAGIYWNGQLLDTFNLSDNEASAAVPSGLIANAGTAKITAVINAPGGGTSSAVPFVIGPANQVPIITPSAAQHQSVDSNAKTAVKGLAQRPQQFLGWNYGAKQGGPAYLKRFSRDYGGTTPSISEQTAAQALTQTLRMSASNSAVSLSKPQSLPGFAFQPTLPTGFLPTSVATGDFNHDGKMDWVISNGGSSDLWLYLGNGDGTARLPTVIPLAGATPLQVTAVDLRKTGVLDLVVAEADSSTLGVLLGNGDGTFAPEVLYDLPAPPLSLAVADLNGDGNLDVVLGVQGDYKTGAVITMLGDGKGKFSGPLNSLPINFFVPYFTTSVAVQDLNGDGLPDLVLVDEGGLIGGVYSYLNRGDGSFKEAQYLAPDAADFGSFYTAVTIGDLDEDGCADAVTTQLLGLVQVFKGNCDGSFQSSTTVGGGEAAVSVQLADMNGDGHLDVVTAGGSFGLGVLFGQEATNLITVLLGDGKGNLSPPRVYRNQPSMFGLALADLNGDGRPDVIAASQDTDTVSVLVNDGHANLPGPTGGYIGYITGGQEGATNAPYSSFYVQDIDGDGKPDLALVEAQQSFFKPWEFTVMLGDGAGHFGPPIRSQMADGTNFPSGHVLGDFRDTGRPDLLVYEYNTASEGNPSLVYSANTGGGSFGPPRTTVLDPTTFAQFGILAVGDFNHDGKLDFVAAANLNPNSPSATQGLTTFLGNGDGTFRQGKTLGFGTNLPLGARPASIFVGDFNKDGKLDVLVWVYDNIVGTLNHNVYEFLGNGDGTFAAPKLVLPNFGFFTVADLNHDGLPDIVEYNEPTLTDPDFKPYGVSIYLCQPDGSFQLSQTYQPYGGDFVLNFLFANNVPQQGISPMVADFNGDGNPDIAMFQLLRSSPNPTTYLQILAGNGDGTFTPTYNTVDFHKRGTPTNAADVNGDGRADLIEVDGWPASYHVIPGAAGPAIQLDLLGRPTVGANGTLMISQSLTSNAATTVQLSASDTKIQIPSSATIPAGSLHTTVPFTISSTYDSSKVFSLSAQFGSQMATVYSYQTSRALAGFHLYTNSSKQTTPPAGTTSDFTVGVVSMGGYSTAVQFACQGLPAGASCQFGASPLSVGAGQTVVTSLAIQTSPNTPLGSYPVVVTGSDGSVSDQLAITLNIADFNLTVSPSSARVVTGGSTNLSLVVGGLGGWSDLVTVSCQMTPTVSGGCNATQGSFVPGTYSVSFFASNTPAGDYSVMFSGSADGVTHSAPAVVIHVGGATASVSPSSATISVGSSANFTVTLNSQNGFADQFAFDCPGLPSGLTCTFSPRSGNLPAGGTLTSTLNVAVTSKTAGVIPPTSVSPGTQPRWLYLIAMLGCLALILWLWQIGKFQGTSYRVYAVGAFAGLILIVITTFVACGGGASGGGSSSGSQPPSSPPPPAPPPQSVTVTISVLATSSSFDPSVGNIAITIP